MGQSVAELQTKLMRDYYKNFSKYMKGRKPEKKIAWLTSFTPVEILEALDIAYYYPESYAAVIAASGKEQTMLEESGRQSLSLDCCAYSCCIEGNIALGKGPRGTLPPPDVLIATNNQCNTLPNWWNILAVRFGVPLIVLDYPGEAVDRRTACTYVTQQHKDLIGKMEALSGRKLDPDLLDEVVSASAESVAAWRRLTDYMPVKALEPVDLFDAISFLITSRCRPETAELYKTLQADMDRLPNVDKQLIPLFWLGYPLWYHPDRYLKELLDGCRISGANYLTWWNLDFQGKTSLEQMFYAYNYTFLNLKQETRTAQLLECIKASGAMGAVTLRNKSCKCDFVSARDIMIPQAELEIDMVDRTFLDIERARQQIALLKEAVCTT